MSVKISYGVNSTNSETLVGKTVNEAINQVRGLFDIPSGATFLLNNLQGDGEDVLEAGDSLSIFKPSGEKGAKIKYGINEVNSDAFDGKSLRSVMSVAKGMLSLPNDNVSATVNGTPVDSDYVVQPGDVIMAFKAAGEKGSR